MKISQTIGVLSALMLSFSAVAGSDVLLDPPPKDYVQDTNKQPLVPVSDGADEDCKAPIWAVAIGHEQKWKLHNGCPSDLDKPKPKPNVNVDK